MFRFSKSRTKKIKNIVSALDERPADASGFAPSGDGRQKPASSWRSRSITASSLAFLLALLVLPILVNAQVLYGSLTGNITDPKEAFIPGAKVEITNVNTGVMKTVTTDDRGSFLINDLQPGVYKVVVSLSGFKSLLRDNIQVNANAVTRLDAQLETGDVKETVTVNADAADVLQTDRADVSTTQSSRQVNNLPLTGSTGRNYQSLMQIVPGAVLVGEQNSAAGSPQRSISFNVNGVSRLQNNTRIDGASVVYPWLPTNTAYVPTAEAIQEVNVATNAFDAEQGQVGGAAINVSLKSGTNDLHGAGWIYNTNSTFGKARNYFQTTPKPNKDILTQYGFAVGGPIYFPSFGKDGPGIWSGKNKLFFFVDYEKTTRRQLSRLNTVSIAPAVLRPSAGGVDFSSTGTIIYDPASNPDPALRTPFPNNIIPLNRIDIGAIELIRLMPLPNLPGFANNFVSRGTAEFDRTNFDTKINFNPSEKMQMWGRFSYSPTLITEPPLLGEAGGDALNGGQLGTAPGKVYVASIGGTYTFSSSVVLDAVVGYTRQHLGAEFDLDDNFSLETQRIPGTNGPDRLQAGIASFQVNGWANMGNPNTGNPFLFRDNQYTLAANLSWLKGAHSFRFGLDYQDQQINHFQPQGGTFQTVRGTFQFNGNATALQNGAAANSFNAWAAFLLGLPNAAGKVDQLRNPNSVYMKTYALYARDHWQVNRNLTLNYGLRWEIFPFPTKDNTGVNRFDPDTGQVITGGLSGVPKDTGAKSGFGKFLPRIGVAYRIGDKTVIRGGFGQSSDPRPFIDFRNAYPVVNAWAMPAIIFNGVTNAYIPVTNFRQGLVNTSIAPNLNAGIIPLPANSGTTTFPKTPMRKVINSFNVIVERQLPWKFKGSLGYVGTRVIGQMGFININASAPGTGTAGRPLFVRFGLAQDINEIMPYGDTTYDSMQMTLMRRFGGSTVGMAYTWSKAINYADNDANPRIQYLPAKELNRGPAGYDRTHNLQIYGVYDLPFGKGQQWASSGVLGAIFGGFQLNGVASIMSGTPITIVQGNGFNLNAAGSGQVPDQILTTVNIPGGIGVGNPYFDRNAFAIVNIPTTGTQRFGTAGRNNIRGPGFFNIDLGLFRTFSITETIKVQLRAEALNALNHANFANPQGDINNSNFGYITSTTGTGERNMRFALRITF
ncbi:MAG: TonB-dependent receptor [Acidobacteria bacterium]|nr:TonB-dependent receptor [Acidobacteriota bacterium]